MASSYQSMREHDALDFLRNSMICHVLAPGGNMKMKAVYLGLMIRKLVFCYFKNCCAVSISELFCASIRNTWHIDPN